MPKIKNQKVILADYLGIDPGVSGGFVVIYENGDIDFKRMPETELDIWTWIKGIVVGGFTTEACLEQVSSSPQMGVASAFTFGRGYGGLKMALTAAQIPFVLVTPQVWQKGLKIPPRKKTEPKPKFKDRLRAFAQRLYPDLEVWKKTLGEQRAVCDALLIAHYCKMKHEGKLG